MKYIYTDIEIPEGFVYVPFERLQRKSLPSPNLKLFLSCSQTCSLYIGGRQLGCTHTTVNILWKDRGRAKVAKRLFVRDDSVRRRWRATPPSQSACLPACLLFSILSELLKGGATHLSIPIYTYISIYTITPYAWLFHLCVYTRRL